MIKMLSKYWLYIKSLNRRNKIVGGVILLVVVVIVFNWVRGGNGKGEVVLVKRGTVTEEVSITGKTEAIDNVTLAFEKSGKVARIYKNAGEPVRAGEAIVALDAGDLYAQLGQAKANVDRERARLNEILNGARPEDVSVTEAGVESAEIAYSEAAKDLIDKIRYTYDQSDDAVRNKADKVFNNPRSNSVSLKFKPASVSDGYDVYLRRVTIEKMFADWNSEIQKLDAGSDLMTAVVSTRSNLDETGQFLDKLAYVVNDPNVSYVISESDRSGISTARSEINTAMASFAQSEETYRSAKSALDLAQRQLSLKTAKPLDVTVAQQQAQVDSAQAGHDLILAQISKMRIVSPFDGMVTKQEAKLGEIVSVGTNVVSVISPGKFQIEANVPEVDIRKMKIGDKVRILLDAFPGETFIGTVSFVDPAETIVDGVVNYQIKIVFDKVDERLKSGMTANLYVATAVKMNVLVLPNYAIVENEDGAFVEIGNGKESRLVPVKIGIRGLDGGVEILSGVKEGDKVFGAGTVTVR